MLSRLMSLSLPRVFTVKPATVGVGGFVIYNDSAADLYLAAGSDVASLTNYTWKVP